MEDRLLVHRTDVDRMRDLHKTIGELLMKAGGLYGQIDGLLAQMVLAGADGCPNEPTSYGQRHVAWAKKMLGKSTKYTIGGSGCLITAYASALTDAGKKMNPGELNDWLVSNNGFAADKEGQIVNFVYAAPDKLGVLKFVERVICWDTDAPMATIKQFLDAGDFVLVEVDFEPDPDRDQHWVRLLDVDGKIMDPWTGDICQITKYRGKNVNECIRAVAYYKRTK